MGAFSIFKDKKKQNKNQTPTAEAYYGRLANRAKIGMFSSIIALVGFCLFSYAFYSDELTVENFRYLLKFISFEQNEEVSVGAVISFDTDKTNNYAIVRGDIAVLSNSQLTVYDTAGQLLQRTQMKNDTPMLLTAGKNMIIYDLGGNTLDIYNSFSQVYTEDFGYPILGVSAADDGSYAVLSGAKNYRSAVFVYDSNYRIVFSHYFPTEYSTALEINPKGDRVLVLSHISENGAYLGSAALFDTGTEEPVANFKYVGELPLSCHFSDDGYLILTDSCLRFYSNENQLVSEIPITSGLINCEYGKNHVALIYDVPGLSESKTLTVYNLNGNVVHKQSVNTAPDDILLADDRLYYLSDGELLVYDLKTDETLFDVSVSKDAKELLINNDKLLVFTDSNVTVYGTDSLTETPLIPEESLTEVSQ